MHPTKTAIRQKVRQQRQALDTAIAHQLSLAICRRIRTCTWYLRCKHLAGYMPVGREVDVRPLLAHAARRGASAYLPRLEHKQTRMVFCRFKSGTRMKPSRLGIAEPVGKAARAEQLDLILLPLVAFDLQGNRLGQGGGHYDRFLANLKGWAKPLLVGVAYDFQEVEQLPLEPWDIPLDAVVTPTAIHHFSGRTG